MRISEIISKGGRPFPSLEIVPPLKGIGKDELVGTIRPFMEFNPPYINVTRHRHEYEFVPRPDGSFERIQVRPRMDQADVCDAILGEFDTEVVPHIICGGASAEDIRLQVRQLKDKGISNILALRGDCLVGERRFTPEPDGYRYASELVSAVKALEPELCIGVGAYPEKHFEAANLEEDIANLRKKVDAGADFIITQMFFDNAKFYDFTARCREAGIDVPIIPGLKPITGPRHLELLPESFSIDIPEELCREIRSHASDKQACYSIGREWCTAQCRDLLRHGVKAVHFYTMGKPDNVIAILRECF